MTRSRSSTIGISLCGTAILAVSGCKDLTGSPGLPAGTPNPAVYNTPAGALGMRTAAVSQFVRALPQYVVDVGLFTDELEDVNTNASPGAILQNAGTVTDPLDERFLPVGTTGGVSSYGNLQAVREFGNQAIGALAAYDTVAADTVRSKLLRGELYAFEGYAEIMLADLFCSGVPLSTLDFQKDFTYAPSTTTAQVYHAAIAKFDTALVLAGANPTVSNLARVGQGRAFLDLGNVTAAADDVTVVPDGYSYQLSVIWIRNFTDSFGLQNGINIRATISDREGHTGLPFRSSADPRTADTVIATTNQNGVLLPVPLFFPTKYIASFRQGTGAAPFILASGIEARLIQAEAQLQPATAPRGPWVTTLNRLRTDAVANTNGLIPTLPDTLTDPGAALSGAAAAAARIALLFRERANWLFLDGHRQGDLRRLLRQYGQYPGYQRSSQVYPTGTYLALGVGLYGDAVVVPIPTAESANPLFPGCLDVAP